ncbi:hypothetical protein [uncultured Bartonella sp.]|uniref:hypothetical protein n=1 Tax=uncultured Bartonella sp. TaxID=104108 RepID=UPI0026166A8C|nr:hypothetical protein [uncultured Bartonella sp.]
MRYSIKILSFCLALIVATLPVSTAHDTSAVNVENEDCLHQPLPSMPKTPVPKVKNIVFNAHNAIDPIVTGPRG